MPKITVIARGWIILILLLTAGSVWGAAPRLSPTIKIVPERYHFGDLTEGQVEGHVFVIKNIGKASLLLDHVYASCGCSRVLLKSYQLKPGEQTTMEVFLDTHGKAEGDFSGTLEIPSNDPQVPVKIVYLTARIKASQVKKVEEQERNGWITITPHEYMNGLKSLPGLVLVDVRSPEEYQRGHIAGSKLIPLERLKSDAEVSFNSLDTPVVLYCQSGKRSRQAAQMLVALGYANIYDMGGIADWPYEIERKTHSD
ncbi:MAG TPA: rhodanese-like domain-containing protein [Bacillota bacterium]|nr:rhodanese-like domain-containing protein [Bacillota bacterium]